MQTPWGQSDSKEVLAEGIVSYSTPSHGGIRLSLERQRELSLVFKAADNYLKTLEWWEEDCDWAIPYLFFAEDIQKHGKAYHFQENLEFAKSAVARYHPTFKIPVTA